ncbi:MAG: CHAT domain-containing protein, partial [Chloroflexi bacterium]
MIDLRPAQGPRLALQISPRDEGLSVRVVESPVGEAAADIVLQPIDEVMRMVSQPTFHEDVGRGLFRSLLPGPLGELYRAAFAQANLAGARLTVELRFDQELVRAARYPWELLHDGTRFLLQAGAVNLVRYLTFPEPPRPLTPRSPLEILVVAARPKDQPPLASEFEELQKAFAPLIAEDRLDLAYLLPPTWDALMDWVLAGAPGVLHFEGHGAFTRTGLLIFENLDGQSDPVDAMTLGHAFYSTDLRLAVLSACDTSKAAGESLLGSVAPALILAGIPAVVAMQQSLPDESAIRFSRGFYQALLAGQDLESAVLAGRKQLIRSTYWYVPTLYLRASKAPEIRQAVLERRIDTAGPRSAPVDLPLRFGLWIRRPDSPAPSDDELRRLLGLEREEAVSREMTRAAMMFPVEIGQIRPGTVDVRISAPGCDLHTDAIKTMTVCADFDTPPLWYPLTPRQVGRLDITFELMQGGAVIASVAH